MLDNVAQTLPLFRPTYDSLDSSIAQTPATHKAPPEPKAVTLARNIFKKIADKREKRPSQHPYIYRACMLQALRIASATIYL